MSHTMELGNAIFGHSRGEVPIPRSEGYEEELQRLFDAYSDEESVVAFDNETFSVAPYFWGDCDCDRPDFEHTEGCAETRPNFHFKPDDYQLKWYKYPLRDSYANRELSLANFAKMIDRCIASLEAL
jgi:hypothetical protein